jgi:hypothetical protein
MGTLDGMTQAIRNLRDADEEEKAAAERAAEEIKGFARKLTPQAAAQFIAAWFQARFLGGT